MPSDEDTIDLRKGVTNIARTIGRPQTHLMGGRPRPRQRVHHWNARTLRSAPGEQRGLVEASLTETRRMKRDGDQAINGPKRWNDPCQRQSQVVAPRSLLSVLEPKNRRTEPPVVRGDGSVHRDRDRKLVTATPTDRERHTAPIAEGIGESP